MSSIRNLADKVHDKHKVWPAFPFGVAIEIGAVGVVEDDQFSRRGTVLSVLNTDIGETVTSPRSSGWNMTSGRNVKINFLADGKASTLFPDAPKANAKIEISFSSEESFLATVNDLTISTLRDPRNLINSMMDAYRRGVWRKEYLLIYEIVTPAKALIMLSRNAGTNLLLAADGAVTAQGIANLAGNFSLTYQTQDVVTFESGGQPLFYNAYRVKEGFWTGTLKPETKFVGDPTGGVFEVV